MALHFVIKTTIFEPIAFAIAGIVGHVVVYRGFETKRSTQDEK